MDVFPTAYFGNVVYFKSLVAAENPIIETQEHFVKQSLRSRCEILGPNGVQVLSLATAKKNGSKTCMNDIEIVDNGWQKIHWKSIEAAYASSPYFDYYGEEILELINFETTSLIELNKLITNRILTWLDFDIKIDYSTDYVEHEIQSDYRNEDFTLSEHEIFPSYTQVFESKANCIKNLSILDLVLNEGPLARKWILNQKLA